jgi:hypothetical protein
VYVPALRKRSAGINIEFFHYRLPTILLFAGIVGY